MSEMSDEKGVIQFGFDLELFDPPSEDEVIELRQLRQFLF